MTCFLTCVVQHTRSQSKSVQFRTSSLHQLQAGEVSPAMVHAFSKSAVTTLQHALLCCVSHCHPERNFSRHRDSLSGAISQCQAQLQGREEEDGVPASQPYIVKLQKLCECPNMRGAVLMWKGLRVVLLILMRQHPGSQVISFLALHHLLACITCLGQCFQCGSAQASDKTPGAS